MMESFQGQSFTLIGTGALGGALSDLLKKNSFSVHSVYNSRGGVLYNREGFSKTTVQTNPFYEAETGDVIFICVPDDDIPNVAARLSNSNIDWSNKSVVHCSGNLFSDELNAVSEKGAQIASMHPLQTFHRGDRANRFDGIFVSLEGSNPLCDKLKNLLTTVGAKPLKVRKEQKQILHIAAVFASNYVVAVLHEAEKLISENGIENSLKPLEPLIHQTIDNALNSGPAKALSGPVARGDEDSVCKHLDALEQESKSQSLYIALGLKTVSIAKEKGSAANTKLNTIEQLLKARNQ